MKKAICYCGHDCSRCLTYLATINNDEDLRKQSQEFYKTEFGIDIPLKDIHCLGARSEDLFYLCKECPFIKCCREHSIEMCCDCPKYPCKDIKEYQKNTLINAIKLLDKKGGKTIGRRKNSASAPY